MSEMMKNVIAQLIMAASSFRCSKPLLSRRSRHPKSATPRRRGCSASKLEQSDGMTHSVELEEMEYS
jgi:hypothetical protein